MKNVLNVLDEFSSKVIKVVGSAKGAKSTMLPENVELEEYDLENEPKERRVFDEDDERRRASLKSKISHVRNIGSLKPYFRKSTVHKSYANKRKGNLRR